jgi:hypothetical protein
MRQAYFISPGIDKKNAAARRRRQLGAASFFR